MATWARAFVAAMLISIATFVLNFTVFTLTYNRLGTPFLTEEQRVRNADLIITVALPAFAAVAALIGLAV